MITTEEFIEHYKDVKHASPQTLRAYESDLAQFVSFAEGQGITRIAEVDHQVIRRYMEYMRDAAPNRGKRVGLSDATIARRLAALSSFIDYHRVMKNQKLHNPIPDFSVRWVRNDRPKPVEREVIDKLLSIIECERDRVLMLLFLASGLRVAEMALLNRDTIAIHQTTDKNTGKLMTIGVGEVIGKGNKLRTFLVYETTLRSLVRYVQARTDDHSALFISERKQRMAVRTMQERLSYWCRMAEVHHINVHRLRHTFATSMVNAGMDIMQLKDLLGHSSLRSTLIYTKLSDTTLTCGYHSATEYANF